MAQYDSQKTSSSWWAATENYMKVDIYSTSSTVNLKILEYKNDNREVYNQTGKWKKVVSMHLPSGFDCASSMTLCAIQ